MKDITEQMLNDYKHFIKKSHWEEFKQSRIEEKEAFGPIVNILDVYSADGKELLERKYQTEYEIGTNSGFTLDAARAGVKNLNVLLEKNYEYKEAV